MAAVFKWVAAAAVLLVTAPDGLPAEDQGMSAIGSGIASQQETRRYFEGVLAGDLARVKAQLDQGVDINAVNNTQQTALHVTQDRAIAALLIERGADVHALDDMGMTPIFNKEIDIAAMLLAAGADINAKSPKGNSPFLWYTYSGYLDGLKWLVANGADVGLCNADGQNAVDIAAHFHPGSDTLAYLRTLPVKPCK